LSFKVNPAQHTCKSKRMTVSVSIHTGLSLLGLKFVIFQVANFVGMGTKLQGHPTPIHASDVGGCIAMMGQSETQIFITNLKSFTFKSQILVNPKSQSQIFTPNLKYVNLFKSLQLMNYKLINLQHS